MTIQPLSVRKEITVTEPVSTAYERMKAMLFQPFDLGKWFALGFCAWLAGLGESGGGGFGGTHNFSNKGERPAEEFRHFYHKAHDYVVENLHWIIPVAIVVVVTLLALGILVAWLNSRGKFMFLHNVALNKTEISEPWEIYARQANSLFWFRLVIGFIGMILILPLVAVLVISIVQMIRNGEATPSGILKAVIAGLACVFFGITFALIHKFLADFVVPIMFLRRGTCLAAWREFLGLLTNHIGNFILYILFQIALAMAIATVLVFAVLLTCCIAGCLMALPFLGTVLLLPVLVFKRSYSLYYLTQYGPQYDVFGGNQKSAAT